MKFLELTVKPRYFLLYPEVRELSVSINHDTFLPIQIEIYKTFHNGTMIVDMYNKTCLATSKQNKIYEDPVRCARITNTEGIQKSYTKTQSFSDGKPNMWKESNL